MNFYNRYPRIVRVETRAPYFLFLEFNNGATRRYDVLPLLKKEMFAPLKNPALFRAPQIEPHGVAVSWSPDIDISRDELWTNGKPV